MRWLEFIKIAVIFGACVEAAPAHDHEYDHDKEFPIGDPYAVLGVTRNADKSTVTKAYRLLAKRWHPDKNRGAKDAEVIFSTIAKAYEVLMDPEKREIFDRLGQDGLDRLRDGDPSVKKDYLPPDEVLRRIHLEKDGAEPWHQWFVTSSFAYLASFDPRQLRWIPISLGILSESPSVTITATSDITGGALRSGTSTSGDVTFKFTLSGKSNDFGLGDVTHNCANYSFLGMKTTYYLQCAYSPGHLVQVSVDAKTFKVHGRVEYNSASEKFYLEMR